MKVYKIENDSSAKKFSKMLKKGEWLVFYYADWCGHCNSMKDDWKYFVKNIVPGVLNIAEIENDNIKNLDYEPGVKGFPTIRHYSDNKPVKDFEDERTSENLTKFAKKIISEYEKKKERNNRQDKKTKKTKKYRNNRNNKKQHTLKVNRHNKKPVVQQKNNNKDNNIDDIINENMVMEITEKDENTDKNNKVKNTPEITNYDGLRELINNTNLEISDDSDDEGVVGDISNEDIEQIVGRMNNDPVVQKINQKQNQGKQFVKKQKKRKRRRRKKKN